MVPDHAVWSSGDALLELHENKLRQAFSAIGWRFSRLVNFVKVADYLRSSKSSEREAKIAGYLCEERLILPVEPHFDVAYGAVRETVTSNRCLLVSLLPEINGSFLAAWLNSDNGREGRAAVLPEPGRSPRTMSSGNLLRFMDGLIVPVPDLDVQAHVAETAVMLERAQQRAGQLAAELWQAPSAATEIQSATRHWLDSALPLSMSMRSGEGTV